MFHFRMPFLEEVSLLKQIFFCGVVLRIDRRSHHNLLEAKRKTMSDGTLSKVLACLCEVLLVEKILHHQGM